jgi:hypothetical protein
MRQAVVFDWIVRWFACFIEDALYVEINQRPKYLILQR